MVSDIVHNTLFILSNLTFSIGDGDRYHNDKKIKSSRRHRMTVIESESKKFYLCHLEISNVEARDAGLYKAVAKNAAGEGHATINLAFEEGK